jgi:D-serine deaminase-like pyridoxal phosphate-dependent protein
MLVSDVPTPALVLDLAALDRNIRRMAAFFAESPCRLRPHVKAHKTPAIARRQLAAGSCAGLTCATTGEAEAVASFCDDVLIANEIAGVGACARLAELARRVYARNPGATLTVAVDSVACLDGIAVEARKAGVIIGILVDVNVGQNRCGVNSEHDALVLARSVADARGVRLRGVMGYEGHAQPIRDRLERTAAAQRAMSILTAVARRLRNEGLACEVVSAGGTGTYDISGRTRDVTEIQAGSYVLMDSDYADVGVPFEQAFWVLGTVVSRPEPDRLVADCGHKAVTKDHGLPGVSDIDGATITALNDEHAVIRVPRDTALQVGDRIRLIPSHTDPTVNLHDAFYVVDAGRVVDRWAIVARGYAEQRES